MSNPKVRVVLILVGIVFLKSNGNHREVMATRTATRVSVCPRNEKEWLKASKRLNCSDISPVNRYHCLPADNLTTLLEFCYNRTRPQVVKGLCMVFIEKINIVNHYDCSKFNEGCPNKSHYSNEMYRFPACFEIDPTQHCYKAEVSCQQFTRFLTDDLNTTLSTLVNDTSYSPTADTDVEIFYPLVIILPVLFLLGLIIIFVAWKMRHRLKKTHNNNEKKQTDERKSLLDTEPFENFEDDISKMGIDCLLQRLPSDQERLLMIAKKLKIPEEILYWSLENREKFVKSMKIGNISVYNGRGMVIGCARAGKSTLVKKLKGEKDLNTTSTSGIEVHSHLFKLHKNESTITVCPDKEKNKACLCITPTTLENIEGNKKEASFSVQDEKILEQSKATNSLQTKQNEDLDGRPSSSKLSSNLNVNEKSDAMHSADTAKQSQQHDNDLTLSVDMFQENEINNAKVDEKVDLSDCKPSVSTNNLKMLSLLDFAGHSAYYACHHIFFSPRAFFILVVDMTKELASVASEACKENDLIYSNWTYADYIRYWLGSIHTYSSKEAPVILVLSHAEDNRGDKKKALEYYFKICNCLPAELLPHVDRSRVFSVEKNSDKNMEDLKTCIASTMKSENHWGEIVPISWTKLESILKTLQESCNIYIFSNLLKDVQNENDIDINNEEELITALTFFNETGVILFQSEIKDIIVLNVQWFVDAFKCIIVDETHIDIKDKGDFVEFDELNDHGILSNKLLTKLWKTGTFSEHKISLIFHMKQLDMLAELSKEMWYVPCMNKQKYSCGILENCNVSSTLCFLFQFLPVVIYHRLVVSCINNLGMKPWKSAERMSIFHSVTILCCNDLNHRVLIGICDNKERTHREHPYSIEIQANVTKPKKIDNQMTFKLKANIRQILVELTQAFPFYKKQNPFPIGYRCRIKPFSGNSDGHIMKEDDMSTSNLECSRCRPVHVVDLPSILYFWQDGVESRKSDMNKKDEDEYINQGVHVTTDNKTVGQREDRESTSLKNSQDEYINQGVTTDNKTVGQREDRESTSLKNSQDETINSSTQPTLVPTVSNDENTHVDSLVSVLAGHIKDNVVEARATASGKGTECELKIIPSFSSFDTDSTRDNNITPKSSLDRSKSLQSDLEKRLETFKNYPENAVKDKKELADNGFMYIGDGKNDKVQCVFCRIIFYQWEEADDITSEHRMGSRTCKRVMELDHKNFRGQLDGGMTLIDRILTQNPSSEGRVPVMKDPSLRLESFKYWTFSNKEKPSPEAFSEAGLFYTGKGDHTQCWFCGNLLEEWEPGDVPKEEHDKTFPDCGLVFRDEGSSGQTVML
uniref:Uncharacterized protein LOC111100394 isoform X2 n=1 Tax=Crassostrea virginica TaxID=6565 RepID=A0A8B8ABQ7_CRAVI|nr:uncharacterized protein LOC111100394 isoform X2 [Crassostrea virginica]